MKLDPNDNPDRVPLAIDFYSNDIFNMGDNCIETDGVLYQNLVYTGSLKYVEALPES